MPATPKPNPKYTVLFGRNVAINVDTSSKDEEDFKTVEGKIVDVSPTTIALRFRNRVTLVAISNIIGEIEVQSSTTRSKVSIRKIAQPGKIVRAHLALRHGIAVDLMNAVSDSVAEEMHNGIDHLPLGHRHVGEPDDLETDGDKRVKQRLVNDDGKSIRQHMADRHGHRVGTLEALPDSYIRTMHDNIIHTNLGHRHSVDEQARKAAIKRPVKPAQKPSRGMTVPPTEMVELDLML